MGRRSADFRAAERASETEGARFYARRVKLQRCPMAGSSDYDAGGAYWGAARGGVPPLWVAEWETPAGDIEHAFTRAATRAEARERLGIPRYCLAVSAGT